MGMFDEILMECPNCGQMIYEQSKSGPCIMARYDFNNAPQEVLADLLHFDDIWCDECGVGIDVKAKFYIQGKKDVEPTISDEGINHDNRRHGRSTAAKKNSSV